MHCFHRYPQMKNLPHIKMKTPSSRKLGFAFAIGVAIFSECLAATYYVDSKQGNDANPGTQAQPWKTLLEVGVRFASQLNDGDTVLLKRGSKWNETLLLSDSDGPPKTITIDTYGSLGRPMPVVDGAGTVGGLLKIETNAAATIRNLRLKNSYATCIKKLYSWGTLKVENCTLEDNGHGSGTGGGISISGDGGWIKNCQIYNTANNAVIGVDCSNSLFENITIDGTVTNDGITVHDGSGTNNLIRGCTIAGCAENAVDIQDGYSNTTVEENVLSDAGQPILVSQGANTVIRRNRFSGTGATAIKLSQLSSGAQVYYNIIDNITPATQPKASAFQIHDQITSVIIHNNTVFFDGGSTGKAALHKWHSGGLVTFVSNVVHCGGGSAPFFFFDTTDGADGVDSYNNIFYGTTNQLPIQFKDVGGYSFDDWQTVFGKDTESTDDQDPLFVEAVNGDFRLSTGSPCIDQATSLGQTADIILTPVPQGGGPDIGAYEFVP